jgi:hypothetical protein
MDFEASTGAAPLEFRSFMQRGASYREIRDLLTVKVLRISEVRCLTVRYVLCCCMASLLAYGWNIRHLSNYARRVKWETCATPESSFVTSKSTSQRQSKGMRKQLVDHQFDQLMQRANTVQGERICLILPSRRCRRAGSSSQEDPKNETVDLNRLPIRGFATVSHICSH